MQPCQLDDTSFFEKLQQAEGLDLRDNRGKRHDLAVVLMGVIVALLSHRDGNLSSIHRHLTNHYQKLMRALKIEPCRAVSRAQLPKILSQVSVTVLNQLIFESHGIQLNEQERKWFAVDGKELRGSIQTGARRGEATVLAVCHETLEVQSQNYYNGIKQSEIPTVRQLLREKGLLSQKVSLDALHCNPQTLRLMERNGGIYLVGLKANQAELLTECLGASVQLPMKYRQQQVEKAHGRIESRTYQVWDMRGIYKDQRWEKCGLRSVLKVSRERLEVKSGRKTEETSYYISNQADTLSDLCAAVRNHWQVETNNQIRDCTFREDSLRSKKSVDTDNDATTNDSQQGIESVREMLKQKGATRELW